MGTKRIRGDPENGNTKRNLDRVHNLFMVGVVKQEIDHLRVDIVKYHWRQFEDAILATKHVRDFLERYHASGKIVVLLKTEEVTQNVDDLHPQRRGYFVV